MHKDLSVDWRIELGASAAIAAEGIFENGQSLAIAREAWINAFDKAAEELDVG